MRRACGKVNNITCAGSPPEAGPPDSPLVEGEAGKADFAGRGEIPPVPPWQRGVTAGRSTVPLSVLGRRLVVCSIMIAGALWHLCCGSGRLEAAENLALGARYTLDPKPNYQLTRDGSDGVKLTDGKFAAGNFWKARESTVGWQQQGTVRVRMDLGSSAAIGRICVDSARGKAAGVSFPERIDMFASKDRNSYRYLGDLMAGHDHGEGGYLVRKFCAELPATEASSLELLLKPKGNYSFIDEVELFGAASEPPPAVEYPLAREQLGSFQHGLVKSAVERHALLEAAKRLLAALGPAPGPELGSVRKQLQNICAGVGAETGEGALATERLRERLFALHSRALAARFTEQLVVWRKDPWAAFTPLDSPATGASLQGALRLDLMRGGVSSDAVILTNNSGETQSYRISTRFAPAAAGHPLIKIREAVPVLVADGSYRADPLVDLVRGRLRLKAGESKQLWLTVSAPDAPAGRFDAVLELVPESGSQQAYRLPLEMTVWQAKLPRTQGLKVNTWSYLNWRPIDKIAEKAVADLEAHHVNVIVLHPDQIPWPRAVANGSNPRSTSPASVDYRQLDRVLMLHRKADSYLFFLDFRDPRRRALKNGFTFMSGPWQCSFEAWIRDLTRHLGELGIPKSRFAFYPVDEPQNSREAGYLLDAARLIKGIDPELRLFTTIDDPRRIGKKELARLLDLVDIFQVSRAGQSGTGLSLLKGAKNLWFYDSTGGKRLDPLQGYRLQAWRAYRHKATGIGFWAYADTGASGSGWDDLDGSRPDYSVVYEGRGDIISSKRWEAWREGVEDYQLLSQAARHLKPGTQTGELESRLRRLLEGNENYGFFEKTRRFLLEAASRPES